MHIAINAETLRYAAEIMADRAIETENPELAAHTLAILDSLMRAMEPQGVACLMREQLTALALTRRA